jgi:hypothetical protein
MYPLQLKTHPLKLKTHPSKLAFVRRSLHLAIGKHLGSRETALRLPQKDAEKSYVLHKDPIDPICSRQMQYIFIFLQLSFLPANPTVQSDRAFQEANGDSSKLLWSYNGR